jgi:integrase/recombinase XerD
MIIASHSSKVEPSETESGGFALLEKIFERPWFLARHLQAPLLDERVRFLTHLSNLRFTRGHLRTIAAELLAVIRMLNLKDSDCITPVEVRRAAQSWAERPRNGRKIKSTKSSRDHFVNVATKWLGFLGRLESSTRIPKPFDVYLSDFAAWMENERGLSSASIRSHCWKTGQFLAWFFEKDQDLGNVSIGHIEEFLAWKGDTCWNRKSVSTAAQALRAFFRHAEFRAWCRPGIANLIEGPRAYQKDGLPDGPTWPDVRRLVDSAQGSKSTDYRARAMLLLLAVYGLRSSEVTGLLLSDIDWRAETLTIDRRKGGGPQPYPLVQEVGDAILNYLRHGRPRCECRNVLVTLYPPHHPIAPSVVWAITSRRFRKLGIRCRRQGPHTLRHACATRLLQGGASLKEIGDLLGHRDADSAAIYAKVDLTMLREVATVDLGGLL